MGSGLPTAFFSVLPETGHTIQMEPHQYGTAQENIPECFLLVMLLLIYPSMTLFFSLSFGLASHSLVFVITLKLPDHFLQYRCIASDLPFVFDFSFLSALLSNSEPVQRV